MSLVRSDLKYVVFGHVSKIISIIASPYVQSDLASDASEMNIILHVRLPAGPSLPYKEIYDLNGIQLVKGK